MESDQESECTFESPTSEKPLFESPISENLTDEKPLFENPISENFSEDKGERYVYTVAGHALLNYLDLGGLGGTLFCDYS